MDNILEKLKAHMYERASSPLLMVFMFSWITWNIRTLIVLFGRGEIKDKLDFISKLYPEIWSYFCQGVLFPLASAAAVIFVYPYIARFAFKHWNSQIIEIKKIQQKQDDDKPATMEEIRALRKASLEIEIKSDKEIQNLVASNNELKLRNEELIKKIQELEKNNVEETNSNNSINLRKPDSISKTVKDNINKLADESSQVNEVLETINTIVEIPENKKNKLGVKLKSIENNFGNNMDFRIRLPMLSFLAVKNGIIHKTDLVEISEKLNSIEINASLEELRYLGFIKVLDTTIELTSAGNKYIVEKGILDLAKIINEK